MAKESKGQQVKTFQHFEPTADGGHEKRIVKVYFQAKDGRFMIEIPEHISAIYTEIAPPHYGAKIVHYNRDKQIAGSIVNELIEAYTTLCTKYEHWYRNLKKKKIILYTFQKNMSWNKEFHARFPRSYVPHGGHQEISFTGTPAIHLHYRIAFIVGDSVYTDGGSNLQYKCKVEHAKYVDWTEERETFFANTVNNIERLIMAFVEFFDDPEANITKSIENGGVMMIAPPAPTED